MNVPVATYRLQFHAAFTLAQAGAIVPYLKELGVSDIYASPVFKSQKGSLHGYDIVDAAQINPELGGRSAFDAVTHLAREHGLGWVQDIVPNHMAFCSDNRILMDVLEKGPLSKYYRHFDIDWEHPYTGLHHKLLVPFLGDLFGVCLDRNEIRLGYGEEGITFQFHDWKIPLRADSYPRVLGHNLIGLEQGIPPEGSDYVQFLEVVHGFRHLSHFSNKDDAYNFIALLKARLWNLYSGSAPLRTHLDAAIAGFNGTAGEPRSFDRLEDLLAEQHFRLSYWKVGNEEINYRRFFTINGLISLREENSEVFSYAHALTFELIRSGQITGLRVDHIDGLYSPLGYLRQLRAAAKDLSIVVEKILDVSESLSPNMPVQGTTGYDFMNTVNGLFIDRRHDKRMDRIYRSFTGVTTTYRTLVRDKKRYFMGKYMAGDIDNLALLLRRILSRSRYGKDMTLYALRRAIVEIMAHFPVYRAYMGEQETAADKNHVREAVALAQTSNPGLLHEIAYIGNILQIDPGGITSEQDKTDYCHFAQRFQQYSGAIMAKSAEDTTFYIYNRLLSLNEVGSDPSAFGLSIERFHELMARRQARWPRSMNATATHDTKRGEDVRQRLNVLSHIPQEWERQVRAWNKANSSKKTSIPALSVRAPHRNDEYFIYQTLIGTYPFDGRPGGEYAERMKTYLLKAIRESQVNTSWANPNHHYEEACIGFLEGILRQDDDNEFLPLFVPFQRKVARQAVLHSLCQVLLKITCPGVPDFYQGCELWDLSVVDPDNRRPVDYTLRRRMLQDLRAAGDREALFAALCAGMEDGRIKMFVTAEALAFRNAHPELFLCGDYVPMRGEGPLAAGLIAFARCHRGAWSITAVARFADVHGSWPNNVMVLPEGAPRRWRNVFSGRVIDCGPAIPLEWIFNGTTSALLAAHG